MMKFFLYIPISLLIIFPVYGKNSKFLPKTFSVEIEQQIKSSLSGRIKKSIGTFDYKFPGFARFEFSKPSVVIFVSNPNDTWYYRAPTIEGAKGDLIVNKTSKNSLVKFFDILNKGFKSNKYYKVKKGQNKYKITFSKKMAKKISAKHAFFNFQNNKPIFSKIKSIKIDYIDKQPVTLVFKKIKENIKHPSDKFFFKIPPKTKINN